jgi:hypothetical protein
MMSSLPTSTWVPSSSVLASSVVSRATGSAKIQTRIPTSSRNSSRGPIAFQRKILIRIGQLGRKSRYQLYTWDAVTAL